MSNEYRDIAKGSSEAAVATAAPPKPSPWILGRWRDLMLFVGTPLLIIPAYFAARTQMTIEDIALFVMAFGALGHHLPGMMRAYGDHSLFERFRVRFILAPIFLAGVCVAFTMWELSGIVLAVYIWGAWHGLMQTYGFVRIYDAKKRSFANWTKRLDFYMCVAWIVTGVLWSPTRVFFLLELYHVRCGVPLPPAAVIAGIQYTAAAATGIVTLLFIHNHVRLMRMGQAPSSIKILLLATSFGFWWYANFAFSNMLVGVAMFEIFHDTQYLAIVWVFNRSRVKKDPNVGGFTRFLFRRSGVLVGIYVGLVFAYGSLHLVARGISEEAIKGGLTGLLAASALLHFYYDGFIWKVREKKTGENLGIAAAVPIAKSGPSIPSWLIHGAKWSLFVVPLAFLGMTEPKHRGKDFDRLEGLAALIPTNPQVHQELGIAFLNGGETERALEHYHRAIELGLTNPSAHVNLGEIYLREGRVDDARAEFNLALEIDRRNAEATTNLGTLAGRAGDLEKALAHHEQAIRFDSSVAIAHLNRGLVLSSLGRPDDAFPSFERAVELDDELALAHRSLAGLLGTKGRLGDAVTHYERAIELEPDHVPTYVNLSTILSAQDELDAAATRLQQAIALQPRFGPAHFYLAKTLEKKGDRDGAIRHYTIVTEINPRNAEAKRRLEALQENDG